MELNIYKKDGSLKLTVSPSDSSTVTEEVGGECSVSLSFDTFEFRPIEVNDYIEVAGVRYKARMAYRPKMKNRQSYSYSMRFYAPIHDAEQVLMKTETDGGLIPEFSLWGGPREHLQKWVDNMNRLAGSDLWTIGSVITGENKNIDYQNVNCWDAAFGSNGIAATYETEMWADGYVINLCKCERGERVTLGYGNGLTGLTPEDNSDKVRFFTRLYPLGSTKNIDVSTYGFSRLQLPSRATFVDHNTDRYGVFEDSEEAAFADIYPQYIGTVSAVRSEPKTDENGKQFTVYYIKDDGMTWEPQALPEKNFMLSFQTGDLQGYGDDTDKSFQAEWHKDTKEWEIINVWLDENTQVPGGNIVPIAGNQYFPWNMIMPQEYITDAQNRYAAAVNDFVANYSGEPVAYSGSTDYIHCAKQAVPLHIGQNVRLESDLYFEYGYQNTRITKVVRKLCRLTDATVTFAEQIGTGWKKSVDNQLSSLHYELQRQADQAGIDVIKTTDSKTPSDNNVFSALRSLAMFLRKDKADSTSHLLTLLAGAVFGENKASIGADGMAKVVSMIINEGKASIAADGAAVLLSAIFNGGKAKVDSDGAAKFLSILLGTGIETENFSTGALGSGFCLKKDENGDTYLEVDRMLVRKVATFIEVLIQRLRYVGGQIILTPASMSCIKVEDKGTYYRCYFRNTDGTKTIKQEFVVGDQARSQTFNIKEGISQNVSNTYYWRLVIEVGDDYIDLSKADCDAGSTIPAAGDDIVQLGNRTDATRQTAIILAAYGNDAPYIKMYKGINSYVMDGKEFFTASRSGVRINSDMFMLSTQNGNQSVDGIINNAIDGIVISGVNILADSDNGLLDKLKVWPDNVAKYAYSDNDGWRRISLLDGDLTGNQIVQEKYITTEMGRDFTLSVLLRTDGTISSAPYFRFRDRNTRHSKDVTAVIEPREQGTYRLWATCKDGLSDNLLVFQIMNLGTSGASYVEFRYPQLEYGNKPTEWRESPDDLGARLQVLDDRITAEVHALEYASKNLLVGSDIDLLSRASGYNLGNNAVIKTDDGWWRVDCPNGVSNGEFLIPDLLRLTKGVTYTESIEVRSDAALTAEIRFYSTYGDYQKINSEQIVIEPFHWRLVGTFTFKEAGIRIIDVARISAPNATYVEFRFPMLTEGDSYVPWQPAAEDETDTRTHLTRHDSEIRQMADEITLRVTKTEYDQNNNEIGKQLSEIKQTADSITSTVQKEISDLTIGGDNCISNSDFSNGTSGWSYSNVTISAESSTVHVSGIDTLRVVQTSASDSNLDSIRIFQSPVARSGDTVSFSCWVKASVGTSIKVRLCGGIENMKEFSVGTSWTYIVFENVKASSSALIMGTTSACTWYLSEPMLVRANKATSWTKRLSEQRAEISTIKQTADSISLKVNDINDGLSATGIDIKNKKIDITADKLSIKTNSGKSVTVFDGTGDVPKLKADYIDVENLSVSLLETKNTTVPVKLYVNGEESTINYWGLDTIGLQTYRLDATMGGINDSDGKGLIGAYWKINGYRKMSGLGGMKKLYAIFSNEEIVMIDKGNNCRCRISPKCIMLDFLSQVDGSVYRSYAFGISGTQIYAEGKYYSGYNGTLQGQLVRDGIICSNNPLVSPYYEIDENNYLT